MQAQAHSIDGLMPDMAVPPSGREAPLVPEGSFSIYPASSEASTEPSSWLEATPVHLRGAPQSWTASFLAEAGPVHWRSEVSRFGIGIGLAALYGLALGVREGGASLFKHAIGVPVAMVAVAGLGVPALTIVLTLFNAPIEPPRVLAAASRSAASAGLVLGGFAPAAALFVITSASSATAAAVGSLGLAVAGAIGIKRLLGELWASIDRTDDTTTRSAAAVSFLCFTVFAVALAARVWWVALPLLRGGVS